LEKINPYQNRKGRDRSKRQKKVADPEKTTHQVSIDKNVVAAHKYSAPFLSLPLYNSSISIK